MKICRGLTLNRLQLIKTANDTDFRFGHVLLVRHSLFSKKLIPYDLDRRCLILEMKHFVTETRSYRTIDINSLKYNGGDSYSFKFC